MPKLKLKLKLKLSKERQHISINFRQCAEPIGLRNRRRFLSLILDGCSALGILPSAVILLKSRKQLKPH